MGLDMYAETLIYKYEHPEHKHGMSKPDASMHEENISCGDKITVYIKFEEGVAKEVSYEGSGCVISMGSADILAGFLRGKTINEIMKIDKDCLLKIINIDPGPVRLHCVTLSLRAIRMAILDYEKKPLDAETKDL